MSEDHCGECNCPLTNKLVDCGNCTCHDEKERMSFIPALCTKCAGRVKRVSNKNPHLECIECKAEFIMVELT